jgi:hypothetical protein
MATVPQAPFPVVLVSQTLRTVASLERNAAFLQGAQRQGCVVGLSMGSQGPRGIVQTL